MAVNNDEKKVMPIFDALLTIARYTQFPTEEMGHQVREAISEHHSDEIDGLSDDEKENRTAPVNRSVGGIAPDAVMMTRGEINRLVNDAVQRALREQASASATPQAQAAQDVQQQQSLGQGAAVANQSPLQQGVVPAGSSAPQSGQASNQQQSSSPAADSSSHVAPTPPAAAGFEQQGR